MSDLEHAREMLDLAQGDFNALRAMLDNPAFIDRIFGFFAQQAVEKALKAWLSLIHVRYPFTHDLEELFDLLEEHDQAIPSEFPPLSALTGFAIQKRYGAPAPSDLPLDRPATIRQVETLINFIAAFLPLA